MTRLASRPYSSHCDSEVFVTSHRVRDSMVQSHCCPYEHGRAKIAEVAKIYRS